MTTFHYSAKYVIYVATYMDMHGAHWQRPFLLVQHVLSPTQNEFNAMFYPKKRMAHKIVFGCAACLANTKPCCNLIGEPCSFELNFIHQNRIALSHSRQIGLISVLRIRFFFLSALRSCISCSIPNVETENRKMQEDNR